MISEIEHSPDENKFSLSLEDGEATVEYRQVEQSVLDLTSTFVPARHRNRGIGGKLVEAALQYAREKNYKVIPSCPFVSSFIRRHPDFKDIVHEKS